MNFDAGQLEQIVREVTRQLLTQNSACAQPAPAPGLAPPVAPASVTPVQMAAPVVAPPAPPTTTLVLAQPVITAEVLRGRLTGVRQVQVSPRAVVTPLVRDSLRELKIELVRQRSVTHTSPVTDVRQLVWSSESRSAVAQPPVLPGVHWVTLASPTAVIQQLAAAAAETLAGLIVTPRWAEVACQANRLSTIRAVTVSSLPCVDQVGASFRPNLFVINAANCDGPQAEAIIRRIVEQASVPFKPEAAAANATRTS